jgi:hypothetical protein
MVEALANWNRRAVIESPAPASVVAFVQAWNDNCGPLQKVTRMPADRMQKLKRRIAEGLTLADFTRAAWTCSHTQFLLHGSKEQSFAATFDWLLKNSGIVAKVLDGTYGPTGKTEAELRAEEAQQRQEETSQLTETVLAHMAKRMDEGATYPTSITRAVQKWRKSSTTCLNK